MAVQGVFCASLVILSLLSTCLSASLTVEVTVPLQPITVGGVLPIQCQISNMDHNSEFTVKIIRVNNGRTEELTSGIAYLPSSLEDRVFVTKRNMPRGIQVYFMTIVDITIVDRGEYFCKVLKFRGANYVTVAEDKSNVEIYHLPNSLYPQCSSTPTVIENMNENVQLKLTCVSANGVPAVNLRWIDNSYKEMFSWDRTLPGDDTVSAEIDLPTESSLHGSTYTCEMTSPGFPDVKRTCKIGPITMHPNFRPKEITHVQSGKDNFSSTDNCKNCGSSKKIVFLKVLIIGASMLCVLFLITTIIMAYLYHSKCSSSRSTRVRRRNNARSNSRNARNVVTTQRDGVYLSLQKSHERSSWYIPPSNTSSLDRTSQVFMTVDDPRDPGSGNKVQLPKEIFDELCRTLQPKKV